MEYDVLKFPFDSPFPLTKFNLQSYSVHTRIKENGRIKRERMKREREIEKQRKECKHR
jgi:hypothetical protein